LRAAHTTRNPSAARARAVASPMPLLAPVTTAVRSGDCGTDVTVSPGFERGSAGQHPDMSTRLGAAVLGALGGILLAAGGGLSYLTGQEPEWHRLLAWAGYTIAVWALVLLGYGIAPLAPVW